MISDPSPRPLKLALKRGIAGHCPACGQAKLFRSFLKPVDECPSCRQDWTIHRSDDFPAYLTILIVGHLLVPIVVKVNLSYHVSDLIQMMVWPAIALVLSLLIIQPAKGFVMALQWAR